MQPMTVFHFTPIVMMAALVALPFIWLVMPRLLPDNSPETGHEPRRFHALLRLRRQRAGRRRSIGEFKAGCPASSSSARRRRRAAGGRRPGGGLRDPRSARRGDAAHGRDRRPGLADGPAEGGLWPDRRGPGRGRTGDRGDSAPDREERSPRRASPNATMSRSLACIWPNRDATRATRAADADLRRGRHPARHRRRVRLSTRWRGRKIC